MTIMKKSLDLAEEVMNKLEDAVQVDVYALADVFCQELHAAWRNAWTKNMADKGCAIVKENLDCLSEELGRVAADALKEAVAGHDSWHTPRVELETGRDPDVVLVFDERDDLDAAYVSRTIAPVNFSRICLCTDDPERLQEEEETLCDVKRLEKSGDFVRVEF